MLTAPWRASRLGALGYACVLAFLASLIFGGATSAGHAFDVVVQLSVLPLIALLTMQYGRDPHARPDRVSLAFCGALVALPLLQLSPMPSSLWAGLSGRANIAAVLSRIGAAPAFAPLSVAPSATELAVLSLIPPVALYLGVLLLPPDQRRTLVLALIAFGLGSVFLGMLQVFQGPESPLRLFEITNRTEAVGFFANRNHFAALLFCALALASAWTVEAALEVGARGVREPGALIKLVTGGAILVIFTLAQLTARSRAGVGLAGLAIFGAAVIAFSDRRSGARGRSLTLIGGVLALALVVGGRFGFNRIAERFSGSDVAQDARYTFARVTLRAAADFLPFGAGVGAFGPVYAMTEQPDDMLDGIFANHAHNDYLEVWLETGFFGAALIAGFIIVFAAAALRIWRGRPPEQTQIDWTLSRAATILVALLLLHSLVDYPLRTNAIMAVMALACGLEIGRASCRERV